MNARKGKDKTRSVRMCGVLNIMKTLKKCDYGWVQEKSNETDADVGDTCMVPSVQMSLRY